MPLFRVEAIMISGRNSYCLSRQRTISKVKLTKKEMLAIENQIQRSSELSKWFIDPSSAP